VEELDEAAVGEEPVHRLPVGLELKQ
jgi:hypothetical protein